MEMDLQLIAGRGIRERVTFIAIHRGWSRGRGGSDGRSGCDRWGRETKGEFFDETVLVPPVKVP